MFLPFFSMLIVSLDLGSVCLGQGSMTRFVWSSISFQSSFSSLIVWADGIKKCGWLLEESGDADSRPTPDSKCKLVILSFITLQHLLTASFVLGISSPFCCYYKWCGASDRWGWFNYIKVCGRKQGLVSSCSFWFFLCFCCFFFSVSLFRWQEHDDCVFFSVFCLLSLSLIPLTRSY